MKSNRRGFTLIEVMVAILLIAIAAVAALGFLVGLVGADRVAYGTDLPFDMMGGSLDAQLGPLELSPDERRAIASTTAEAWFGTIGRGPERAVAGNGRT